MSLALEDAALEDAREPFSDGPLLSCCSVGDPAAKV